MSLDEAIGILETHNKWRRDEDYPSKLVMAHPTELGHAIDVVVNHFNSEANGTK